MIDISSLLPQRVFLIQGTEETFNTLRLSVAATLSYASLLPRFTVEHAKDMVAHISQGTGSERIVLVYYSVFSPDAAQVLLKSLEDPDDMTTVMMITPYPYLVPATVRSRVLIIHGKALEVMGSPYTSETAAVYIKKELDTDVDDAAVRRAKLVHFLDALEQQVKASPAKVQYIYRAKHMLFSANLPVKYIADYVVSMVL